jgi:hypothetical protein
MSPFSFTCPDPCRLFWGTHPLEITFLGRLWRARAGTSQMIHLDPDDLKVAARRIESTICALGGYVVRRDGGADAGVPSEAGGSPAHGADSPPLDHPYLIFRHPSSSSGNIPRRHDATVGGTTDRHHAGPAAPTRWSMSHDLYVRRFHQRYFVGGNGVSWEVEESPPVMIPSEERTMADETNRPREGGRRSAMSGRNNRPTGQREGNYVSRPPPAHMSDEDGDSVDTTAPTEHGEKMKYRCKLCGQPKQNHACPYQQSLQRSIGVMVDPTVHAYTSAEPGVLTPALSDMNNFVAYGADGVRNVGGGDDGDDYDPDAFDAETAAREDGTRPPPATKVTPDSVKAGLQNSPETSTLSTSHSLGPSPPPEGGGTTSERGGGGGDQDGGGRRSGSRERVGTTKPDHGGRSAKQQPPLAPPLPPSTLVLRPEHYRAVSHPKGRDEAAAPSSSSFVSTAGRPSGGDFTYPHVPLTFQGRKRLSDTLFVLSKDIPTVLSDVASLLRVAREQDEWDLAVAEILTQVVVALFCAEGDHQLDGLRSYLLNIGISS